MRGTDKRSTPDRASDPVPTSRAVTTGYPGIRSDKPKRVEFSNPRSARCFALDGRPIATCKVIAISDTQLELASDVPLPADFLLLLSPWPKPIYRSCRRTWVRGGIVAARHQRLATLPRLQCSPPEGIDTADVLHLVPHSGSSQAG